MAGYFYVGPSGPYSPGANRFQGKISSTVATTLGVGTALPDDTEVSVMVRDPMGWLSSYKVGKSWRAPNNSTGDFGSNFASGSNTGEQGTKIWLMGVVPTTVVRTLQARSTIQTQIKICS